MKKIYDCKCPNQKCPEHEKPVEVWKRLNDDYPMCQNCGTMMIHAFTKTPSFYLVGGSDPSSGFSDDGRIVTGHEGLRRRNPEKKG